MGRGPASPEHEYPHFHLAHDPACVSLSPHVCLTYHGNTLLFAHDAPDLWYRCESSLSVGTGEPGAWRASVGLDGRGLTLEPSVYCQRDGYHGWVRDGEWVPLSLVVDDNLVSRSGDEIPVLEPSMARANRQDDGQVQSVAKNAPIFSGGGEDNHGFRS